MKKLILLFVAVFSFSAAFSQFVNSDNQKGHTAFKGQNPDEVTMVKLTGANTAKSTLNEGFEGTVFPPLGWTSVDADNDGNDWFSYSVAGAAHTGTGTAASASWTGRSALTPNNHLITPALIPATGDSLKFWFDAQDPAWVADKFQVLVSTTGRGLSNFTDTLFVHVIADSVWTFKALDLSTYIGDTIFVSFNHFDCTDWFYMKLDDITGPTVYIGEDLGFNGFYSPNGGCGLTNAETVKVQIANFGAADVSTFDVAYQVDGGAWVTEAYSGTAITAGGTEDYTFTATADLSATGAHTILGKVVFTTDTYDANDTGRTQAEHFVPVNVPYNMGFEPNENNGAWKVFDSNQDGTRWWMVDNDAPHANNGSGYAFINSPGSDDWLVTGCINLTAGVDYQVEVWATTFAGGNESFSIMIGSSPDPTTLTTNITDVYVVLDTWEETKEQFTVATTGVYYIGFHANSASSAQAMIIDDISIDIYDGIESKTNSNKVSMYPNPVNDVLNVVSNNTIENIQITNMVGQVVIDANPVAKNTTINTSNLESGIYMVNITTKNGTSVKKLTVK